MAHSIGDIPFLFACLGARRLPGPILVAALGDLGVSESSARTTLARMVRAGMLGTERFGRVTRYRLAGPILEEFERIRSGTTPPPWNGAFEAVIYEIPEERRRERDELRADAFAAHFGAARPGVLIGLDDPGPWLRPWRARLGPDVLLARGRLEVAPTQARELAERAWHLEESARRLTRHLEDARRLTAAARRERPRGAAALRQVHAAFAAGAPDRLASPALPVELLPPGWPEAALHEAHLELARELYPRTADYVGELVGSSPYAHLVVRGETAPP